MGILPYRCYVTVSRSRLLGNLESVRTAVGPDTGVIAVVKAGAYGHGMVEVARLLEENGVGWLAVSSVEEGVRLRQGGLRSRILILAGSLEWEHEALFEFDLTPSVHSLEDIWRLDRAAEASGRPLAYHLKLDTGMGRMGTREEPARIIETVNASKAARLDGVMTHFASAADFQSPQTTEQIERFLEVLEELEAAGIRPRYVHESSSNALCFGRKRAWHNLVRPGHVLYGYVSPPRGDAPPPVVQVAPALEWKAKLLVVKDVPAGALIGYGGTFRAPKPMRIGVMAAGYADGYPHRLSNKGKVIAGGRWAPVIGTVSMDLTTLDLSLAPHLKPGDDVTLLGSEDGLTMDAQQLARLAGTISYNLLCGINARVKRVYV